MKANERRRRMQGKRDRVRQQRKMRRRCRVYRCTDEDCSGCVVKTGAPCHWVEPDLCSACAAELEQAADGPVLFR